MALGIAMLLLFIPLAHQQIIGRELLFFGAATFVSGIRDYHQTLILTHIMFAISMVFIMISTVKSIIHSPIKNFYHNLGCIMLCVLSLTDI